MRRYITPLLIILLLISGLWTAWQWLRPYELGNQSPWQVQQVTVRRDHDYAWMEIELTLRSNEAIPMPPLSRLMNAMGTSKEPADAKISGDCQSCQVRYWLEWSELKSSWSLQMLTDTLRIKESGTIKLEHGQTRTFRQPNW